MKEPISAFIDNEMPDQMAAEELVQQMLADESAAQAWQSYHLISDVMNNKYQPSLQFDIAANVAAALIDEPTVLAQHNHSSVVSNNKPSKVLRLFSRGGHYAIAASVAAVVLLGVQQFGINTMGSPASSPVLNTTPYSGMVSPVSLQASRPVNQQSTGAPLHLSERDLELQKKRINAFLQDHRQQQK